MSPKTEPSATAPALDELEARLLAEQKRHQEELAQLLEQAFSAEVKLVESKRRVPARRRR